MEEKKITIEDLAVMVQKGFSETSGKMDKRFDQVENRLDRIENTLIKNHEARIKRLEDALVIK